MPVKILQRTSAALRSLDREKAWESARTTFGIFGALGFAGMLASMHLFLGVVAVGMAGGTWYSVYRMMEH